jgi:hypothetical protein
MRLLPTLRQWAIATWLAWLGLVGLMVGFLAFRVMHPHFLPATSLLLVEVIAASALAIGGLWRLIRGPGRQTALRYLLLGLAPPAFLASHFLYGLSVGYGRQFDINWSIKLLMPLGESFFDLIVRYPYPERTAGEKVVMIARPLPTARAQVDAMDRHIASMEARLGRPMRGKVHWVRGPILGLDAKAIYGMCMASAPGQRLWPTDAEGLTNLDRHEVAHVAIASICPVTLNPPALLSEGWAEANSGQGPVELADRAIRAREHGTDKSFEQLTSSEWYGRHEWPVYLFGGPLCNYLLEKYGPDLFVSLYVESRPGSFAEDCRRILGVSLDQLETDYWADIERLTSRDSSIEQRWLSRIKLGRNVDGDAWQTFLREYFAEAQHLSKLYENVQLQGEFQRNAPGLPSFTEFTDYRRAGPLASLRRTLDGADRVSLAHPQYSFEATRKDPQAPWEIRVDPELDPKRMYRRIFSAIERENWFTIESRFLDVIVEEIRNRIDSSDVALTRFERIQEKGRPIVRVVFERPRRAGEDNWHKFTSDFAENDHFAVRSYELSGPGKTSGRAEFEYDHHDGLPVLRMRTYVGKEPDGKRATSVWTMRQVRFEPSPEDAFLPDRVLEGPRVRQPVDEPGSASNALQASWYGIPLVLGVLSLVGGAGLRVGIRTQSDA